LELDLPEAGVGSTFVQAAITIGTQAVPDICRLTSLAEDGNHPFPQAICAAAFVGLRNQFSYDFMVAALLSGHSTSDLLVFVTVSQFQWAQPEQFASKSTTQLILNRRKGALSVYKNGCFKITVRNFILS